MKRIWIFSLIVIIVDQILKSIVNRSILLNHHIKIINHFFYISHVHNEGAAWSIMSGNRVFLIMIAIISIIVVYKVFMEKSELNKYNIFVYSLLLGGIIGNLIDRIIYGYVIDYIELIFGNYHYPIFNLADICIVISIILIIVKSIQEEVCKRKMNE